MKQKKTKKTISTIEKFMCPRCKCLTNHTLVDADKKIYKCSLCKEVHAK